jgi:hypothetical protein
MRESTPGTGKPSPASAVISPAEKIMCEWEARHDVAARGRIADPAAALQRYLTQSRLQEERRHREPAAPRPAAPGTHRAAGADPFVAEHPLVASWLRWGEDRR